MHEKLIAYIAKHTTTPLSENDTSLIRETFIPKKIRKRQYFLQEGEVCKYMAFLVQGAMRQYSVDDKGTEHIVRLSIEEWWVGDRESAINLTPSIYNIDAWEESLVLTVTNADMIKLRQIPAINELSLALDNKHAIAQQKRVNAAISLSAEQRYAELKKNYPQFLERFPQHIIASYLGITKETLSRVRSNSLNN
ncbi:Crp/Fnr family transcriptional regulator [Fluviicola sp.]|uniref:Crp/Fnr family transcriptional regulator n=1 Tax=Fluviicola sp. TaxID=1917219 RepID=UPI0031D12370